MQRKQDEIFQDSEELAQFRRNWLEELKKRKGVVTPAVHSEPSTSATSQPTLQTLPIAAGSTPASHQVGSRALPSSIVAALNIYRKAVEHERRGELDEALVLYRQAFRMHSKIDGIHHREEMLSSVMAAQREPFCEDSKAPVDDLTLELQKSLNLEGTAGSYIIHVTGVLMKLISNFPPDVTFEPETENEPIHLRKLPDEMLIMVLRRLDPTSIERFACVNRKCRLLTLDPSIWRSFVTAIYKPPQVIDVNSMILVAERYLSDYRRVFIEHPRVRMDGVYIATCHYVRPGMSENSWVNVDHLITYHRYLRFYSNGQVLSLLANEEYSPQQVIPMLKPTLRMKGLLFGTWSLSDTTIQLSNLLDASGRFASSGDHYPSEPPSSERPRYTFAMSLRLLSRPLGRWNKLHIQSYNSVNFSTGDVDPVALKHERPFWFSKVRSYALY